MSEVRPARPSELTAVAGIFALGFSSDPVWGDWTFPTPANPVDRVPLLREFWWPYVVASAKYDGVLVLDDLSAVALWVPPGVPDLDADDEAAVAEMMPRVCGDRSALIDRGWEAFGASRPTDPHWYLSLLATDPAHRGRGLGMELVAQVLTRVDADGQAAYLESTNPGNLDRYRRAGFELVGAFGLPEGPSVDRMWRDPR